MTMLCCRVTCAVPVRADPSSATIKGALPPLPDSDPSGSSPLSTGTVVGVTYRAWEVAASHSALPTDALREPPFLQATAPDMAKIK